MKLPMEIESAVQSLLAARGGIGRVDFLPLPRRVPDHVEKAVVFTPDARPAVLVMIAPPAFPGCVDDAMQRAADARRTLGDDAVGAVVQVAARQGLVEGRSFAVVPYLTPMGSSRLERYWHRFRLRRVVFDWLREVTRRTLRAPPDEARGDSFATPLRSLARMEAVDESVRAAAIDSLRKLEAGGWEPRWVLAHNDLWVGNVLRRALHGAGTPPFAVIDWGASRVQGYPVYDFLAIAGSIGLSGSSLRRELRAYCAAVGCEPVHAKHHLMVGLGSLSLALGEWKVERFAARARSFLAFVEAAQ